MLGLASSLGCSADDYSCLCNNPDFSYGIRDCSLQACGESEDEANEAIRVGVDLCAGKFCLQASHDYACFLTPIKIAQGVAITAVTAVQTNTVVESVTTSTSTEAQSTAVVTDTVTAEVSLFRITNLGSVY